MYGVRMTQNEWTFLQDWHQDRKMFCKDFVDKKWAKTMEQRQYDIQSLERMRCGAEETHG